MRTTLVIGMGLALGAMAAGCERTPETQPRTGATSSVAKESLPEDARNPKDSSIPASEAAQAPQPKDGTPDTALTQKEIRKDMPLPGQANDHSNDAFAKRGDDTKSPSTSN